MSITKPIKPNTTPTDLTVGDIVTSGHKNPELIEFNKPWFPSTRVFASSKYPTCSRNFPTTHKRRDNIAFPFNFDTEFKTDSTDLSEPFETVDDFVGQFESRMPVTYQIKSTSDYRPTGGTIYASSDLVEYANERGIADQIRHQIIVDPADDPDDGQVVPLEFLREHENDVDYWRDDDAHVQTEDNPKRPLLLLVAYCHFAIADIPIMATGKYYEDINYRFAGDRSQGIPKAFEMKRRLTARGFGGHVSLPWICSIDGNEYRVSLSIIDTCALHGVATYKKVCETVGLKLEDKDPLRDGGWITKMDEAYFAVPEIFDAYSLGDLRTSEMVEANARLSRQLYTDLEIIDYYKPPKMSIGSTVSHLIESSLANHFDFSPDDLHTKKERDKLLDIVVGKASANNLIQQAFSNEKLLGKVDGGLCRSVQPTTTNMVGNLVDIDLAAAYTSRMSMLSFPCGEPEIEQYKTGQPLRYWLRYHRRQLVDGCWVCRIKTTAKLSHEQDLILSYFDHGNKVEWNSATESHDVSLNLDSGTTKAITREIVDGALNDTLLEIIEKVLSPKQRDDFLDKVCVVACAYYPKKHRVDSASEWYDLKQETPAKKANKHKWYALPFGSVLIDAIRATRSKYLKKTPQNEYAKLVGNTTYGDSVSRYFAASNMIFGANITAGVRSAMWLAEKGLNLVGSVTDGHVFDLDSVLHKHPRAKQWTSEKFCRLYNESPRELHDSQRLEIKPLHPNHHDLTNEEIDALALEHLQTQFPKVGFLNDKIQKLDTSKGDGVVRYKTGRGFISFEMKQRVASATLHGTANYLFVDNDENTTFKMRSYEAHKDHHGYLLDGSEMLRPTYSYKDKTPANVFLEALRHNPHAVPLPPPFFKYAILKPADYSNRYRMWCDTNLIVGDSFPKPGMIRPFSISHHLFQTVKQYKSWVNINTRWKNKYGYSFELFFLNPDGTLNYQKMVEDLDKMIRDGVVDPSNQLDPNRHIVREMNRHPEKYRQAVLNWETVKRLKIDIGKLLSFPDDGIEEWNNDDHGYEDF